MSSMFLNFQAQKPEITKKQIVSNIAGTAGGYAVASGVILASSKLAKPLIENQADKITINKASDLKIVDKAIKQTLKDTGLSAQGVKRLFVSDKNKQEVIEKIAKVKNKLIPLKIREWLASKTVNEVLEDGNAYFSHRINTILTTDKKKGLSQFEDIGHALNFNVGKAGKISNALKPLLTLAIVPITIALVKSEKPKNEKPKTIPDRITSFVKKYVGVLTFIAFIPILVESGMAASKGRIAAKKVLPENLFKKAAKTMDLNFTAVLANAIGCTIGAILGKLAKKSITNKIAENQKLNEKLFV